MLGISKTQNTALIGALFMVLAGLIFAVANTIVQYLGMTIGIAGPKIAFWQYAIALAFFLPWLWRNRRSWTTTHPIWHIARVALSALGVQFWVMGLAHVPIWQAIALLMLSPFFATLGARIFLGEALSSARIVAVIIGFLGGMIILAPWSDAFSLWALMPVAAAALWAGVSLLTKFLSADESPEALTFYLLALLTPFNALAAIGTGLDVPMAAWGWLIGLGAISALAQYALARAYEIADAAYLQPFDHIKLIWNVLLGIAVFGFAPPGALWLGAAFIIGAALWLLRDEVSRG